MPPSTVKTIRDLIYWEYAKLIAGSAVGNRKNYGFITSREVGSPDPKPHLTEKEQKENLENRKNW